MRHIYRPPGNRDGGEPPFQIVSSTKERGGMAQSTNQEHSTAFVEPAISCAPGALIATIVADAATASGASGVHIEPASDVFSITTAIADTTTASNAGAVDIDPAGEVLFFFCGTTMADTVSSSAAGAGAIDHDRTACIAVNVADTATASGASVVHIVRPVTRMSIADTATLSLIHI